MRRVRFPLATRPRWEHLTAADAGDRRRVALSRRIAIMSKFLSALGFFSRRGVVQTNASAQALRRFRNSMPGELGLCAAVRLYGVGR